MFLRAFLSSGQSNPDILPMLKELQPYTALGVEKKRIGRVGDGGYVIVDIYEKSACGPLYGYGVGYETSFEEDFSRRYQTSAYIYDGTLHSSWQPRNRRLQYKAENIEPGTLERHLQENGHAQRKDLFLKMDIEGSEFTVLKSWSNEDLLRFTQIVIEVHNLDNDLSIPFSEKVAVLHRLNKWFYLLHVHANNTFPPLKVGKLFLPPIMELTFVRKDLLEKVTLNRESYPTSLDCPNLPQKEEITLHFYPFLPV